MTMKRIEDKRLGAASKLREALHILEQAQAYMDELNQDNGTIVAKSCTEQAIEAVYTAWRWVK